MITLDNRERRRQLTRLFTRLVGVGARTNDDAVLRIESSFMQCLHGAGRHRDRRLARADEMDSRGCAQRICVCVYPLRDRVTRARKRFRALHRRAIKRGEKGAGLRRQLR